MSIPSDYQDNGFEDDFNDDEFDEDSEEIFDDDFSN